MDAHLDGIVQRLTIEEYLAAKWIAGTCPKRSIMIAKTKTHKSVLSRCAAPLAAGGELRGAQPFGAAPAAAQSLLGRGGDAAQQRAEPEAGVRGPGFGHRGWPTTAGAHRRGGVGVPGRLG